MRSLILIAPPFHHLRPLLGPVLISFAILISLLSTGCACGRFGTLLQRRTITGNADVVDVYGLGALLRLSGVNAGFSFGWNHVTYIYPRLPDEGMQNGVRWSFGILPRHPVPFFLATRIIGAEVTKYPAVLQAHIGYRMDAFTFAARADESRTVKFHYKPGAPGETSLTMNPLPKSPRP